MAEINTAWLSAMFAADTNFQLLAGLPTELRTHLNEFTNTNLVKALERISLINALIHIFFQEFTSIIA